jgi:glucose 1-dehydrogenase
MCPDPVNDHANEPANHPANEPVAAMLSDTASSTYSGNMLKGQRALVTGANSGIGADIARALALAGAQVAINYVVRPDRAQKLIDEITAAGGEAIMVKGDVSKEDEVEAMFAEVVKAFGSIDILVNNAGLQRDARIMNMSLADWNTVIGINLTGQFLCARAAIREFIRRGPTPETSRALGKIICMSSVHEVIPWAGHVNYATSKGGVAMMMKTLAQEVAPLKIRVNSIAPGAIETPINTAAWSTPTAEKQLLHLIPYGRVGVVRDIANAAVFLASDVSDYMTGAVMFVDGGMTLYPGFEDNG